VRIRTIVQYYPVKLWHWIGYIYKGTLYTEIRLRCIWWKCKYTAHQQQKRFKEWQKLQAENDLIKFRLAKGLTILLCRDDKLSEMIFMGTFELNERRFIEKFLKPGDIFVDVGANLGLFSLIAARIINTDGQVYAFEPTATTFRVLVQNVQYNDLHNGFCYQLALSNKSEQRFLIISTDGYGAWNSLATPTSGSKFSKEEVQCITWDHFAEEHDLIGKVALMKIDVEGWEFYVLEGGTRILSREDAPDLLIEFTDVNAESAGLNCEAVYSKLCELGYQLYSFDMDRHMLYLETLRASYPYMNLLATKHVNYIAKHLGFSVQALTPTAPQK